MGEIGLETDAATDILLEIVKKPRGLAWKEAVVALRRFGPKGQPAAPILIEMLAGRQRGDPESLRNIEVALTLAEVSPKDANLAVSKLQEILQADTEGPAFDAQIRSAAAAALGELGDRAKPAVPALIRALRDRQREVRQTAAEALSKIEP